MAIRALANLQSRCFYADPLLERPFTTAFTVIEYLEEEDRVLKKR
jgi:hypothetical protein